ncbi:Ionotropic receptor 157 [Hyalella azteca]|uniref:Ionotropic receptor 157 n=1 Tax=Hyalella azteca TaxID=294128 RepID=A0A6A0H3V2_HYAAZ|nr:Ionotropic receptor 157 [Hyalella azteca]
MAAASEGETSSCIRAAMTNGPPHVFLNANSPRDSVGTVMDVLKIISKKLGWCFSFRRAKYDFIGNILPNDTWDGAIGEVIRGECDMLTSTVIPNYQRNLALDITVPLWEASHTVVYRKAQIQPDITGFLKPFSGVTWLCVLATFAACVASLFLMLKMRELLSRKSRSNHDKQGSLTGAVPISVITVVKIFLNQTCEREKRFSFMRMAMGSTILGGFLLSAFYKAFLLSMLVLPRVVEPFNSLEDLVTRKPMPYLLIPGSLIEAAAKEAEPNTTFGKLYRNVDGWEKDFLRMIEKVAYGKWAIVGAKEGLHAAREVIFAKTRTCPLTNKDRFLSSWYSLCFRKNSPYTAPFNQIAVRLKESGILDMLDKKYRPNEIKCSVAKDVLSLRPLGITDLFGVFLLYAGGMGLATISFILERWSRGSKKELK